MRLQGATVVVPADPVGALGVATKEYVDAGDALAEKTANKSVYGALVPNGYAGVDASGMVPSGLIYGASASVYGVLRIAGDIGGTAGNPTVPGLAAKTSQTYVDNNLTRYSVRNYGAAGNGTTDDTAAIQAAITACPPGGVVFFPPGLYAISTPIIVPPQITLEGSHRDVIQYTGAAAIPTAITALSSFVGNAMIKLMGKADQSPAGSVDHVGAAIRFLVIDGSGLTAGSATRGIRVEGLVRELLLEHVTVRKVNDTGFWFGAGTTSGLMPASFRVLHCLADTCGNNGYTFTNTPDSTLFDCNALGNTNVGFYIAGFMNGQIANCRSEWSGLQGFYFTSGYWGNGQGSGGCNVLACSTDRSNQDGIRIDATGGGVLQFTNCFNRRDGRNSGSGGNGYAAFNVMSGCTMPVVVDNHQVYPGVDDGGAGTNSPQIGFLTNNSGSVTLNSGYIWAATTAISIAGSTVVDGNIGTATGLTTAPTRVAPVADVPVTRQVIAGSGLSGGGALTGNVTLSLGSSPTIAGTTTVARMIRTPYTLTWAATQAIDASLANHFRVTLGGNTTISMPTNLVDGQDILLEIIQNGTTAYTVTLASGWNVTTANTGSITVSTTLGTRSYIAGKYRSSGTKIDVLSFSTGIAA